MFSYIFMKILESRPHRYDWGINLLTGGQAGKIKENIVTNFVQPGMAILDVGCGTGDLAVRAAQAGAFVTGVDISEGMLAIARGRVKKYGLESKVILHHAGVVEIDNLLNENSFDLITSTLVISELYAEEREWTLRKLYAILKPNGTLLVAGEVMIFTFLVILSIGFDLKGIVGDRTSEAEAFMQRLGLNSFGDLFRAKGIHNGLIIQDRSMCVNFSTCRMVCPVLS